MKNLELDDGRSIELSTAEKKILKELKNRFRTTKAASRALGVSRDTYKRIQNVGTCHPKTYQKIQQYATANQA